MTQKNREMERIAELWKAMMEQQPQKFNLDFFNYRIKLHEDNCDSEMPMTLQEAKAIRAEFEALREREKEYIEECNKHFEAVQAANQYAAKLEAELKRLKKYCVHVFDLKGICEGCGIMQTDIDWNSEKFDPDSFHSLTKKQVRKKEDALGSPKQTMTEQDWIMLRQVWFERYSLGESMKDALLASDFWSDSVGELVEELCKYIGVTETDEQFWKAAVGNKNAELLRKIVGGE